MKQAIKIADSRIPARLSQRQRRLSGAQGRTALREQRDNTLRHLAKSILEDPELQLPYGFGFDEFISKIKERSLSTANDAFLFTLNNIFTRLSVESDIKLVEMHRNVIIEQTRDNFKDKAKAIVLDKVIKQILKHRGDKSGNLKALRSVLPNEEFLNKALESTEIDTDLRKQIEDQIDPEKINIAAENLADEALVTRIQINKGSVIL